MSTGWITEYHAATRVGLITVDGFLSDTFIAFRKQDCSSRLQKKLTGDIPSNPELHVSFDEGVDPGTGKPIAVNVDLSDAEDFTGGFSTRLGAMMALSPGAKASKRGKRNR